MNVTAIAFALAVLASQPASAAPDSHAPRPPQAVERTDRPLSWEGVGADAELDPLMNVVLALEDEELEGRIQLIAINVRASRDYSGALGMLNALWVRAARGQTATPELMSLLALHRASTLHKLGRTAEALAATSALFPDEETVRAAVGSTRITRGRTRRGKYEAPWEAARADERLRELRATLRASLSESGQSDDRWLRKHLDDDEAIGWLAANVGLPSEPIADLVWKGLANAPGHGNNVKSLGLRSVPSLALFSLRQMHVVDRLAYNPIVELDRLDSLLAAKLCATWAGAGDASWRLTLLDVLSEKINSGGNWSKRAGPGIAPGKFAEGAWLEVLAPLLRDETVRLATVDKMSLVIAWNAVPPSAQRALGDALRTTSAPKALELLSELETEYWTPSLVPALEQALLHESIDVRHVAAERLSALQAAEEIIRSAPEPDARMRLALAKAFATSNRDRRVGTAQYSHSYHLEMTPALETAWAELLMDRDSEVARAAAYAVSSWNHGVPETVYRAALASDDEEIRRRACVGLSDDEELPDAILAELWTKARTDASPRVRRAAIACDDLPPALMGETLAALAVDDDATVRAAVDDIFFDGAYGTALGLAFALRVGHPDDPYRPGQGTQNDWANCWIQLGAERNVAALRGAIASGEDIAMTSLIEHLSTRAGGTEVLFQLEPRELAHVIAWSTGRPSKLLRFIDSALASSRAQVATDAMRLLVLDGQQPLTVRLRALSFLREALWNAEAQAAFLQILEDPAWMGAVPATKLAINTSSEARNTIAVRLLQNEAIQPAVRMAAAGVLFSPSTPGARPAALLVLESLGEGKLPEHQHELVTEALETVAHPGASADVARYLSAAVRHPQLALAAIESMNLHGELLYREALSACLRSRAYGADVHAAAAAALVRYGSEAKPVLQEALLLAHPEALAHLNQALSALEAWESQQEGTRGLSTRDEAIAELLALLDDEQVDVRAEAVRGIATFGAIEAIPRLIPLLHDPESLVRAAAREALDRLHDAGAGEGSGD